MGIRQDVMRRPDAGGMYLVHSLVWPAFENLLPFRPAAYSLLLQ